MITYRLQTQPQTPDSPVKFYRAIALSFLAVTIILLGVVVYITSQKANIIIVAKEDNKKINLTIEVGPAKPGVLTVSGQVTSTIFSYSAVYSTTGNKTTDAIATGEIIVYNKGSEDQTLVKTTRFLNQDNILFHLTDRIVVPAGDQIKAKIYADQPGATGNIVAGKFTIPGLNTDKQKVIYGESTSVLTGGVKQVGILKQEDIDAAKNNYKTKVKEAFVATLKNTDKEKPIVSILEGELTCDKKAGDEVSEFIISGANNVALVTYDQEELSEIINHEINNKIDTTLEKVLSTNSEPQIEIVSTDPDKNTAELAISQDVLVTIDANSEKLSPKSFAGKKKSDVEKYLFSLDHVSVATVTISHGWSTTIPGSADKIKVVVKNVQ